MGDGKVTVEVRFADEAFWLTQKAMAELFGVKPPEISKHLKDIFDSGALMETTAADGKNYATRFHNLDAVIAVGYQQRATRDFHI